MRHTPKIPGLGYLIEEGRPLAESIIWELQRGFYERTGPAAWSEAQVPSYVTSTPHAARLQAAVLHAFLWDLAERGAGDPAQPVYFLELASGSGEFGCRLLRRLQVLLDELPPPGGLRPQVIMTDLAESNLDAWAEAPELEPFVQAGLLDLARCDVDRDEAIELRCSGARLAPGQLANPLVVSANYLFDSLPQEVFWVRDGELEAGRVTVLSGRAERDLRDPTLMKRIRLHYERRPAGAGPTGDDELDALLEEYRETLREACFLLPTSALGCLQRLARLAGDRLLVLIADKGTSSPEELEGVAEPHVATHAGCFSFMVDLHLLGRWFNRRGGHALLPTPRADRLKVASYTLGVDLAAQRRTRRALAELVEGFGPCDYLHVVAELERAPELDADGFISLLKLGGGDPALVSRLAPKVLEQLPRASDILREQLARELDRVWAARYRPRADLALWLARLQLALGRADAALPLLEAAQGLGAEQAETYQLLGEVHEARGAAGEALDAYVRALQLDPLHGPAREARERLESATE